MVFKSDFKDKIVEDRICETPGTDNSSPVNQWDCTALGKPYRFVSQMNNVAKAEMKGVEFTFDYDILSNLQASTSYTYTRSEQKSGEFAGQPLNKMPEHMLNVGFDYEYSDALSMWMDYNYRGETSDYLSRTSMSQGTPGYGTFDAGVVMKANEKLSVMAGIYNIANKEITNSEYDVVLDGRRFTVGMNVKF